MIWNFNYKTPIEEFLEDFHKKHTVEEYQTDGITLWRHLINGELHNIFSSKETSDKATQILMLKQWGKKMCDLQKQECVKSYQNSTSLYRVSDDVLNAPFPKELGE